MSLALITLFSQEGAESSSFGEDATQTWDFLVLCGVALALLFRHSVVCERVQDGDKWSCGCDSSQANEPIVCQKGANQPAQEKEDNKSSKVMVFNF